MKMFNVVLILLRGQLVVRVRNDIELRGVLKIRPFESNEGRQELGSGWEGVGI